MTQLKLCAACGDEKLIGVFNLDRTRADGRYPYCKPCTKTRKEKWYLENRAKVLEQVKTRAITAPHKVQDSRRKYYLANSEKVKADTVRWQKAHPRTSLLGGPYSVMSCDERVRKKTRVPSR